MCLCVLRVLYGDVFRQCDGVTAVPTPDVATVLPTCGLTYARDGARLVISD